jgi:hypothetical protein
LLAGDRFLKGEADVVSRRRQREDVVSTRLEGPADETVRRAREEDDHGAVALLLHRSVDEEQNPV